jgi:phospholipase C
MATGDVHLATGLSSTSDSQHSRIARRPFHSKTRICSAGTITSPPAVSNDGISWGSGYVYGFRVPLIVVSPYARAKYISHATHDFGGILKFVETTFALPALGYADGCADDLSDCFDLTQAPLSFHTITAALNAAHFINDKHPPVPPDDD